MSTSAQDEYDGMFSHLNHRTSSHPADSEDRSDSSSDHTSTTLHTAYADEHGLDHIIPPIKSSTDCIPSTQFDANTGPKGVIADARSFETAKKRGLRQSIYAFANGESPPLFTNKVRWNRDKSKSPPPDISDDEDEFMRTWRAKRLEHLTSTNGGIRTRRQSPSQRRYGTLTTVDPAGYLDAIEKVSSDTVIVVLIYDDESPTSGKVEDSLKELAQKYLTVRFIRLHFLDAEMDEIAVPGILAYKGGECFANLVSMISEVPSGRTMNTATIEYMLQQHRVIM